MLFNLISSHTTQIRGLFDLFSRRSYKAPGRFQTGTLSKPRLYSSSLRKKPTANIGLSSMASNLISYSSLSPFLTI